MLLDLFNVKEAAEGFLYLSKRSSAPLRISRLPISIGRNATFLSVATVESIIPLTKKTHWAFRLSGPLPRIYVSFALF